MNAWFRCLDVTFAVALSAALAACGGDPCGAFPNEFQEADLQVGSGDFASLPPATEADYDRRIKQCGTALDRRISGGEFLHRQAVRLNGRLMLRYHPAFTTDTVYYFELGKDGAITNAYKSRY